MNYRAQEVTPINEGVILFHFLIKNYPFKSGMNFMWVDYPNNQNGRCAVFQSKSAPAFKNDRFFECSEEVPIHIGWIGHLDKISVPQCHKQRAFDRFGAYPCQDYLRVNRVKEYKLSLEKDLKQYGLSPKRIDALIAGVVPRFTKFEDE